jgi:pimeloyl-ACP methyl ester carboxylesterase
MTTTRISVKSNDTAVEMSVSTYGERRPVLLLHGGAGPQSMTGFAEQLADAHHVNALVPVADFFDLTMDEVFRRSFFNPEPFRVDPAAMPPDAQAVAAGNRAALAAYAGESMSDPTLAARLSSLTMPTLVLWGASDRIVDADYGRAYA